MNITSTTVTLPEMQNLSLDEEDLFRNWSKAVNVTSPLVTFDTPTWPLPLVVEAAALCVMILLTVCGNLLVILAVWHTPALRAPTHLLIVNLAVADFLLGATVLPLSATKEIYQGKSQRSRCKGRE